VNDLIPLTRDYSTSASAHAILEKIIEIQCMLAKSVDYGLEMSTPQFNISNTPDTQFLVQAEIKAIQKGLNYKEIDFQSGISYKGYMNSANKAEGLGIVIQADGKKIIGEWQGDQLDGLIKIEFPDGGSIWGRYDDNIKQRYGTQQYSNGDVYMGQFINGTMQGYGIYRWASGAVYFGQWKLNERDGFGLYRFA
jgi:hypothetical protein